MHFIIVALPIWGLSLEIVSLLASISASTTDLKRFQTPHDLFRNIGAENTSTTLWSDGRVQVWVHIRAPAGHLAITAEGYSRIQKTIEVFDCKINSRALGPRVLGRRSGTASLSGTAWAGRTGKHKQRHSRVGSSCSGPRPPRLQPFLRY